MTRTFVTIVAAGALAVTAATAYARVVPIEPDPPAAGVELVWGSGAPPHFVTVRTPRLTPPLRAAGVELRWGTGGPPVFVPVTGGRTIAADAQR